MRSTDEHSWGLRQHMGDAIDLQTILCARAYYRSGDTEMAFSAVRSVRPEGRYALLARACDERMMAGVAAAPPAPKKDP